jgi:hypothetical protein
MVWSRSSAARLVGLVGAFACTGAAMFASPLASQTAAEPTTLTFACTGAPQSWTVPPGITSALFDVSGAQGGITGTSAGHTNFGGRSVAVVPVTPGETLEIYVGCQGIATSPPGAPAGWNGGGDSNWDSLHGGGASDVRRGGTALTDRIIVAGGGGGVTLRGGLGGQGSGADGTPGTVSVDAGSGGPGAGATTAGGGAGGTAGTDGDPGTAGVLGVGGDSPSATDTGSGGGGGGGYFGGGGGGTADTSGGGGGGGGSGLCPAGCLDALTGTQMGHGIVRITYPYTPTELEPPAPLTLAPRFTG